MRCHFVWMVGIVTLLVTASEGVSQDQPPVVEPPQAAAMVITAQDDGEGGPPRIMSFQTVGGPGQVLSIAPGMGFGMADAGVSNLMMDDQFQKELELVEEQMEDIRRIQREMQEAIAEEMKSARSPNGAFDPERMRVMGEAMQRIREDADKQVDAVLLPHQQDRLAQMRRQMRMRDRGDADALTSGELAKELGLTEAQIERLKKRSAELEKEMQEEIARLKAEAKEKLLKELTKDQRKKLDDLIGSEFNYERPSFGRSSPPRNSNQEETVAPKRGTDSSRD